MSTLGFVIFGFTFSIYAFLVESHLKHGSSAIASPPLPPSTTRPSAPPASPSLARLLPYPPPPHEPKSKGSRPNRTHHGVRRPPPPPPPAHQMNGGKKIGLLFAGIAGIMQIGVVGFLVYKRRQLSKTKDLFETGS